MSEEGSEDSPPRSKRRIKKVMVVSSDASSDSDESVAATGTRRKRLRVLSDGASDSSGSSVVCAGARRKRALPKLRDSELDSDSSAWLSDHSDAPGPSTSTAKPVSGFASDSSEGNSDKCSICLLRFTDQQVGTPQSCEHIFCLDCITEWSKNVNTCPVDRMTFDSIVVRTCAGGRVLRTEPVKVVERRPSVEMLVIEDPTVCEICQGTDREETMLLCDGCDLGYHMACLTPPLEQVPVDEWLCPSCDLVLSDMEMVYPDADIVFGSRHISGTRASRLHSSRNNASPDEPSTSSGPRGQQNSINDLPTTSRGSRPSNISRTVEMRNNPTTRRRRHKRRTSRVVVVEYEFDGHDNLPVTLKTAKKKLKKRKTVKSKRRQPRTAARRSHVRASVRARLAGAGAPGAEAPRRGAPPSAAPPLLELAARRQRAGIPALSLFGDHNQLDYFSEDDEHGISETASTAVAARPTSSLISAYRQARRKMISIPSPTRATSATPDVLSSILESQTLLHSKKSVVSVSVDGIVNITVETRDNTNLPSSTSQKKEKQQDKIDLTKADDASKKVPSYPGQSRGGGGWGGGYRGNYHREQTANNFNNRGGNYENNFGNGGYQNRQGNSFHQNNNMRRDDGDAYNNYPRRPHQYPLGEDVNFDRNRRQMSMNDQNRGPNMGNPRHGEQQQGRYSLAPSWQPYVPPAPRMEAPALQHRHSFGGFENPLDMRMGQISRQNSANDAIDMATSQTTKHQSQSFRPLPEPPVFKFDKTPEVEKSEDERSDSGLVIDTEKYDPTEPTNDDDSADEESTVPAAPAPPAAPPAPPAPVAALPPAPVAALPPEQHAVQNILAGLDTSAMKVPPNVLDSAVRAVLKEHRNLIVPAPPPHHDRSDDDSEGDCPNFSIYSATSVHIANNADELPVETPAPQPQDNLEDLVQEDDEAPPDEVSPQPAPTTTLIHRHEPNTLKKKSEEELKEKVSKRCPITTNPRNPIKIKLNTPSLIKRQMSLYDEEEDEEVEEDIEPVSTEPAVDVSNLKQTSESQSEKLQDREEISREESVKSSDESLIRDSKDEENKTISNASELDKASTPSEVSTEENVADMPMDTSTADDKLEPSDNDNEEDTEDKIKCTATPTDKDKSDNETPSEDDNDELSGTEDNDLPLDSQSPMKDSVERNDDILEKMTESISETEDERSYTPCLDENKSKDTSLETEKDKGIEGLDTEMISEDEGNEMFSDTDRASPARAPHVDGEEGEIVDKKKEGQDGKKKKKKDSKKEGKEKSKGKSKKSEVAFKKLSKSGKERNYRERDKDKEKNKRERRDSSDGASRERNKQRRKERRKDLERYDVRTLVGEKRRRPKDAFGRDVSPRARDPSASRSPPRRSASRRSTPPRSSPLRSSPRRSPSPRATPPRVRRATSSPRRRATPSPRSASARGASPARAPRRRRRSSSRDKRAEVRRRRDPERTRKRRRSASASRSPRAKPAKRKKRSGSRRRSPRRRSVRRRRRSASRSAARSPAPRAAPPARSPSVDSRLLSPRTPPPEPSPPPPDEPLAPRRRAERARHRRPRDVAGPSKEVFTSGDNILVSVSFKEQERASGDDRRERRRERRRRRKRAAAPEPDAGAVKPVAIIDLERSPFRELTPSPRNVIVLLSDDEAGEKEAGDAGPASAPVAPDAHAVGPKTPPEPAAAGGDPAPSGTEEARGPLTPPEPPDSPDAYDPYEPTRSASASPPSAHAASPPRALMTLEAAQKTNLSADDVIDRRPLSPIEKVMALLQSTRDVSPDEPPQGEAAASQPATEPTAAPPAAPAPAPSSAPVAPAPPAAPPVRIVLPSPTRAAAPKLFLAKPSPIKSDPIKPMPAAKIARAAPARRGESDAEGESPYSPGSSDFGDLFEPPGGACRDPFDAIAERPPRARKQRSSAAKVPVKLNRKKGKTQVGVKIDEDNLKILDDLPSSAVEMQVKSKFLKKLNRQERVVEEVKLVLKPHYNKKHVTKDEYKDILRRAVPKICHNKSGEINPAKIQALVEAYVKKFRKKHKLGLV